MLDRLELIVKDKINDITNKTILIIGLGGVGSYAVESIVRSGIEKVIIVDSDKIDISNLNRQLMTLHSNIGRYKTDVIEERIKDINPKCTVIKHTKFINKENVYELFDEKIDYIIDACDTLEVKKELIKISVNKNIKLISSMGTANKLDPTRLKITDLSKTSYDPIAKILRSFVKKERINKKIMVVCSDETPIKTEKLGSTSFVPSVAGLLCTSYINNDILKSEKNN